MRKYYFVVNGVAVGPQEINETADIGNEVSKIYPGTKSISLVQDGAVKNALQPGKSAEAQKLDEGAVLFVIQQV